MIFNSKVFHLVFLILMKITQIKCGKICYDEYGCFINTPPFGGTPQRLISTLPQSPQTVNTTFTLFNNNVLNGEEITSLNFHQNYIDSIPTKIIVHGYTSNELNMWNLKDAILQYDNVNVITCDWSEGSVFPYTIAT